MDESNDELYKRVGKLQGWDFSNVKHEKYYQGDYKYFDEINRYLTPTSLVLDIGTGGGENLLKKMKDAGYIFGIDNCKEMIDKANENLKKYPGKRVKFLKMDGNNILFPKGIFDIICSRHCWDNPSSAYKLLNDRGRYFSEDIENDDCMELKNIFGRGQCFNEKTKLQDKIVPLLLKSGFKKENVIIYQISIKEYYKTKNDLIYLLLNTPIIPDFFKIDGDENKFNEYANKYKTNKGILLNRKLFGIIAKK